MEFEGILCTSLQRCRMLLTLSRKFAHMRVLRKKHDGNETMNFHTQPFHYVTKSTCIHPLHIWPRSSHRPTSSVVMPRDLETVPQFKITTKRITDRTLYRKQASDFAKYLIMGQALYHGVVDWLISKSRFFHPKLSNI